MPIIGRDILGYDRPERRLERVPGGNRFQFRFAEDDSHQPTEPPAKSVEELEREWGLTWEPPHTESVFVGGYKENWRVPGRYSLK